MKKIQLFKKKEISNHIIPECLNCGKPLDADDVFCSYCGQKNVEKLNFGSFIGQLVSGFFSYDSRFWTTFIPLLIKPGIVSKNYIAGKRSRYVNPFQMYLQVSLLFFLILGFTNNFDDNQIVSSTSKGAPFVINLDDNDSIKNDSINKVDIPYQYKIKEMPAGKISFNNKLEDFDEYIEQNTSVKDATTALIDLGYPVTFLNRFWFRQMQNLNTNIEEFKKDNGEHFSKKLLSKISVGLFIFLPIFTLFFKLVYYRKHLNYMEHLVFVFHVQTVFFLLMILFIIVHYTTNTDNTILFICLFLVYLYMALRKFYQQKWFKTLVKFAILNMIYISIGAIGMLFLSILAFLFD
ncbi:MAG: hypothetical protein COB73_01715 [Flavobacteriaceae bacterium]|nr:MAG: hypothetical protein COB73_01715 [Flavobacteriaceae bacterium]